MRGQRRTRPLLLLSEPGGVSALVAGDRICWWGKGPPPRTPGALRVRTGSAVARPGRWSDLQMDQEVETVAGAAVAAGTTGIVVRAPAKSAARAARLVRASGARVVVLVPLDSPHRATFAASFRSERDPLVRFGVVGDSAETETALDPEFGCPVFGAAEKPEVVGARAFGRRFGAEEGAAGDVVVETLAGEARDVVVAGTLIIRDGRGYVEKPGASYDGR